MTNNRHNHQRQKLLAGLLSGGLLVAACGGSATVDVESRSASTTETTAASTASDAASDESAAEPRLQLPPINVFDVGSGSEVALTSLADDGRPTLLWFYAPH